METKDVKKLLDCNFDTISKRNGIFTARKAYFYTYGQTEQDAVNVIKIRIPSAKIIDTGDHWRPFKGGASIASQSHWYVKFMA
jgi:hypothetical protein